MIMSPSCTTDPCPSTRTRASPPSPPPSRTLMRSLARDWTSVPSTLSDLIACMTVVSMPEALFVLYRFFRRTSQKYSFPANTHTLLDQCSFELINICGMIQNDGDNSDWVQTLSTPADTDQTLAGRCRGTDTHNNNHDII